MAGWVIKTEFITDTPQEHGNWSSVELETEEEAWVWWEAPVTRSACPRQMTLFASDGRVLASRRVPA